jgi:hypothetical protein
VRHAAKQAVAASGATGPLTVEMTVLTARRAAHHD